MPDPPRSRSLLDRSVNKDSAEAMAGKSHSRLNAFGSLANPTPGIERGKYW